MDLYVLIDNQPHGPYTPALIEQYLKSGQLQPSDLAAYAGSADWKPLSVMMALPGLAGSAQGTRSGGAPGGPKPRSRARLALVGLAVAVVVGAVVGGVLWRQRPGPSAPAVKAQTPLEPGLPNTLAELNTWYAEPPAGQNAAKFFAQGLEALQISDAERNSQDLPILGKAALPAAGSRLSPRAKALIAGLRQRNQAVWGRFQEGARYESARYSVDLTLGPAARLPHLAKFKQAAQLGELLAWDSAESQQPQAAVDTLLAEVAAARSLRHEPLLISQLVRVACLALARESLERVVNAVALPPAELDQLAAALDKAETEEAAGTGFTRACVGERVSTLALLDLPPEKISALLKESAVPGEPPTPEPAQFARNLPAQRAFAEETFNHTLLLRKQPLPARLQVDAYFTARAAAAKTNEFLLVQLFLPALGKQTGREAAGLGGLRLAQTAVALERYRLAHGGQYPATVNELSPGCLTAVPRDPFNGEALRYTSRGAGYELSSTGADPAKPLKFTVVSAPKVSAQ